MHPDIGHTRAHRSEYRIQFCPSLNLMFCSGRHEKEGGGE